MFTETNFGSSLIETKLPLHTEEQRKEFISQVVSIPLTYFYQIFYILKNNIYSNTFCLDFNPLSMLFIFSLTAKLNSVLKFHPFKPFSGVTHTEHLPSLPLQSTGKWKIYVVNKQKLHGTLVPHHPSHNSVLPEVRGRVYCPLRSLHCGQQRPRQGSTSCAEGEVKSLSSAVTSVVSSSHCRDWLTWHGSAPSFFSYAKLSAMALP